MKSHYLVLLAIMIQFHVAFASADPISSLVEKFDKEVLAGLLADGTRHRFDYGPGNSAFVDWSDKTELWTIHVGLQNFDSGELTTDGFLLELCHEAGHIARSYRWVNTNLPSIEEDADYWAAKFCAPRIWSAFPTYTEVSTPIDDNLKKKCQEMFPSTVSSVSVELQKARCVRAGQAAYSFRARPFSKNKFHQTIYIPESEAQAGCTPFIENKAPNVAQCGFNSLMAGFLNWQQPQCLNMIPQMTYVYSADGSLLISNLPDWMKQRCDKVLR